MHSQDLSAWSHDHIFDRGNAAGERSTRAVMWITAVMMIVEISGGWCLNSMALLADGFHMSSHAVAIGLSAFAYAAARRHAADRRYAFGTWKIEVLSGFASAVLLIAFVLIMVAGSIERLLTPTAIHYQDAMVIAGVGFAVNVISAAILGSAHHHGGSSHDGHQEHGRHHDPNLRSAYVHVVADAATSVLAILALAGGLRYGWSSLDPLAGIAGAIVITTWAWRLIADTGKVLLDREMDDPVVDEIRAAVEEGGREGETRIADLHVWRVGKTSFSCAMSLVTHDHGLTPETVRSWIAKHEEVAHATIEIHLCAIR